MKNILFVALLFRALISFGQTVDTRINPELLNKFWSAHWISPPKGNLNFYRVYHFRKQLVWIKNQIILKVEVTLPVKITSQFIWSGNKLT